MNELSEILKLLANGQIPSEIPADCQCQDELEQLIQYLAELNRFTKELSSGKLGASLNLPGSLAGSLKGLHANLRHLTWQTQQVAAGDFNQRVDFLGEFSTAFNSMVIALAQARDDLIEKNREIAETYEELRTTQLQMLQQEKMASIGQMAAGVAHEINNPLGFISSNLRALNKYVDRFREFIEAQTEALDKTAEPEIQARLAEVRRKLKIDFALEDAKSLLDESSDGAERVRCIVQNLRSFSGLDEAECQDADLNACLESTISIICNELKPNVAIKREFGALPAVNCRPREINQVFLHLLRNAAQSIDEQGIIAVRTWYDGNEAYVAICDTGCGISEDNKNRIFEPFFTTREVGKGTGLGLSTSYDIVNKHKGRITVESAVGSGSTFIVSLPVGH